MAAHDIFAESRSFLFPAQKNIQDVLGEDWYPAIEARKNEQGRALVEFAIGPTGHVSDMSLVSSEPGGAENYFGNAAWQYVRLLEFDAPNNWKSPGAPRKRYRFSFVFLLRPCRDLNLCEEVAPYPADYSLTVITAPRKELSQGLGVF
jgi:TonB family protein